MVVVKEENQTTSSVKVKTEVPDGYDSSRSTVSEPVSVSIKREVPDDSQIEKVPILEQIPANYLATQDVQGDLNSSIKPKIEPNLNGDHSESQKSVTNEYLRPQFNPLFIKGEIQPFQPIANIREEFPQLPNDESPSQIKKRDGWIGEYGPGRVHPPLIFKFVEAHRETGEGVVKCYTFVFQGVNKNSTRYICSYCLSDGKKRKYITAIDTEFLRDPTSLDHVCSPRNYEWERTRRDWRVTQAVDPNVSQNKYRQKQQQKMNASAARRRAKLVKKGLADLRAVDDFHVVSESDCQPSGSNLHWAQRLFEEKLKKIKEQQNKNAMPGDSRTTENESRNENVTPLETSEVPQPATSRQSTTAIEGESAQQLSGTTTADLPILSPRECQPSSSGHCWSPQLNQSVNMRFNYHNANFINYGTKENEAQNQNLRYGVAQPLTYAMQYPVYPICLPVPTFSELCPQPLNVPPIQARWQGEFSHEDRVHPNLFFKFIAVDSETGESALKCYKFAFAKYNTQSESIYFACAYCSSLGTWTFVKTVGNAFLQDPLRLNHVCSPRNYEAEVRMARKITDVQTDFSSSQERRWPAECIQGPKHNILTYKSTETHSLTGQEKTKTFTFSYHSRLKDGCYYICCDCKDLGREMFIRVRDNVFLQDPAKINHECERNDDSDVICIDSGRADVAAQPSTSSWTLSKKEQSLRCKVPKAVKLAKDLSTPAPLPPRFNRCAIYYRPSRESDQCWVFVSCSKKTNANYECNGCYKKGIRSERIWVADGKFCGDPLAIHHVCEPLSWAKEELKKKTRYQKETTMFQYSDEVEEAVSHQPTPPVNPQYEGVAYYHPMLRQPVLYYRSNCERDVCWLFVKQSQEKTNTGNSTYYCAKCYGNLVATVIEVNDMKFCSDPMLLSHVCEPLSWPEEKAKMTGGAINSKTSSSLKVNRTEEAEQRVPEKRVM